MKVNLRTIIGILGGVVMASCSTTTDEPDTSQTPIQFGAAVSRAAVNDKGGMSSFSVWGGYQGVEDLFNATLVDKNGTYSDGTRYWIPGKTFNFYAVHPATLPEGSVADVTDVAGNGIITVTNFDCSKTGAEAVDLMTATAQRITNNPIEEQDVAAVPFQFSHELAKLNFIVKSENTKATITGLKVYGVNYKGTLTKSSAVTWSSVTTSTNSDTPYNYTESFEFNTTHGWEKDIFGDVLLIPDNDLSDAKLEITYKYSGEADSRTSVVDLETTQTKNWLAGQSYKYTLTIKGGSLSITVNIVDWTEKDTSVSW